MKRIVILLGSTGHGSGAERVLEYLLEGAVDHREQISLLSTPSSSVTARARDLDYEWLPWQSDHDGIRQNTLACLQFLREQRRPPVDLVHSWHTRHLEWALLLGRLWGAACSGTLHDDPFPSHGHFGCLRKKVIRFSARHLDGLAAVSDALALRCRQLGWPRDITVLHNGLPDSPPARRESSDELRLGFMATTMLWKGIGILPGLVQQTMDLPLQWNLFGGCENTGVILDSLRKSPRVHYHGTVPLEEALRHIDILLHLSTSLDPYPTVLLEAARAGIPAIATNTGGSPEIVADGRTGILVPPGNSAALENAIRQLAGDAALRHALGNAARLRFESDFGVARMVADYFAFWNRLRAPHS